MPHFFFRAVSILSLLLVHHSLADACAWDRDTLESETKGIPEVLQIIVGRFERNPDLYYEMRLERVTKQLAQSPDKLELYDDAGVASDRLQRGDEAIAWMHKKQAAMQKWQGDASVLKEHRYRYLANQGTFIAHRWLRNGADRKRIGEMKQARDLIAQAIKLNPDAHFGREKYQLKMMEWIVTPPEVKQDRVLPSVADTFYKSGSAPQKEQIADAVKGLSGIIVLGDAWQSVDTFYALSRLLQEYQRRNYVSFQAWLRTEELVKAGKRSILPASPQGAALLQRWRKSGTGEDYVDDSRKQTEKFKQLRAETNQWHSHRTAYMLKQLKNGRHPDTDKDFWKNWKEPPLPGIYITTWYDLYAGPLKWGMWSAALAVIFFWRLRQKAKRKS